MLLERIPSLRSTSLALKILAGLLKKTVYFAKTTRFMSPKRTTSDFESYNLDMTTFLQDTLVKTRLLTSYEEIIPG
jgi:hypothetical protein